MDRTNPKSGAKLGLLASAAVMTASFSAYTTSAAPRADKSFAKAERMLEKGKTSKAIQYAEAAVQADPRNAQYRAVLGEAYLKAGRYTSAAVSFGDALKLGDTNPRTVLSYALAQTAIGGGKNALDMLNKHERMMNPADAGLALALAGDPERGVLVLTNALRGGQNTPKVRQNLAYTYALAGNWRAARVMAAEDVPADQLDERLSQWASNAKDEDFMVRVSQLLRVAPVRDGGMPTALALSNFPSEAQMAASAKAKASKKSAPAKVAKAPAPKPVVAKAPAPKAPIVAAAKPAAPKPVAKAMEAVDAKPAAKPVKKVAKASKKRTARRVKRKIRTSKTVKPVFTYVSRPVTQPLPAAAAPKRVAAVAKPAQKKAAKRVIKPAPKGDSHMVQLGSYNSEAEAKAGWTTLQRKFGDLKSHDVVITKAEVNGKTFYRVAAAGFGRQGAAQMCSTVRGAGRGCFAYAKVSPPKGAIGKGTRIAAATRR